ncbi:hypothetical protein [Kribbella endophytica]
MAAVWVEHLTVPNLTDGSKERPCALTVVETIDKAGADSQAQLLDVVSLMEFMIATTGGSSRCRRNPWSCTGSGSLPQSKPQIDSWFWPEGLQVEP